MFREKKRGRWRVQRTVNGQRLSKDCSSRDEAERYEYELKHGLVKPALRRSETTFGLYADRWHEDYCKVHKAPSQWQRDRYCLDLHLVPPLREIRLRNLTKAHLLELQMLLRKKPGRSGQAMTPKSVNNLTALAKKMLQTAVDWDLLTENPWASVKPLRVPEKDYQWWTTEDLASFTEKALSIDPEMTRLVTVAFHTGLRPGELAALRAGDVSFKTGRITVKATIDMTTGLRSEATKGKRIRYPQMNQAVREALEPARFQPLDAPVFRPDLFWSLCRRFRKLCTAVGVPSMRFYDLRHSFASSLAMAGIDLMEIQRQIGHRSYQMTLRYAHLHPDRDNGVTEVLCAPKLHPRESGEVKSGGPRRT